VLRATSKERRRNVGLDRDGATNWARAVNDRNGSQSVPSSKREVVMNIEDLKNVVHEQTMQLDDDAAVSSEMALLLSGLAEDSLAAVYHCAKDIIAARAEELVMCEDDMDRVIGLFDAVLSAMLPWLESQGISPSVLADQLKAGTH
jgi:hypothetical protein